MEPLRGELNSYSFVNVPVQCILGLTGCNRLHQAFFNHIGGGKRDRRILWVTPQIIDLVADRNGRLDLYPYRVPDRESCDSGDFFDKRRTLVADQGIWGIGGLSGI